MIHRTPEFLDKFFLKHSPKPGKVLDVGSLDVNGNIKNFFTDRGYKYLGCDMRKGKNVDVVVNGHDLKKRFKRNSFDMVVCFDTLEHDDRFWLTVANMRYVLKPGGWLILGAPSNRHPRHNHPSDYYRFFETSFKEVFFDGYEEVYAEFQCYSDNGENNPDQIYGYARKPKT